MFEKEAEEALQKRLGTYGYTSYQNCHMNYTDGFKDGYAKANEWHKVSDGDLPPLRKEVLWRVDNQLWLGELLESRIDFGEWELDSVLFNDYEITWKEILK